MRISDWSSDVCSSDLAKEKLGFEKVILAGWSGGGSLSMFYQSQAEKPWITATPAGDAVDVVGAKLPKADAVLQLAAHVSRAIRSEERRVGKECVSTCRSRWWP